MRAWPPSAALALKTKEAAFTKARKGFDPEQLEAARKEEEDSGGGFGGLGGIGRGRGFARLLLLNELEEHRGEVARHRRHDRRNQCQHKRCMIPTWDESDGPFFSEDCHDSFTASECACYGLRGVLQPTGRLSFCCGARKRVLT